MAISIAIAACAPVQPSDSAVTFTSSPSEDTGWELIVANLDGLSTAVVLNGVAQGPVLCGQTAVYDPAVVALPLPWSLRLLGSDGSVIKEFHFDGRGAPATVLIRAGGVRSGVGAIAYGPAPEFPCPT